MRTFAPRQNTITADTVIGWGPCSDYSHDMIREVVGDGITLDRFLDLDLPINDKIWVACHPEAIGERLCHEFACACADRALSRIAHPDERSVAAVAAKRAWLAGELSDDDLLAARSAAWLAAWLAAEEAERQWQLEWILEHVE